MAPAFKAFRVLDTSEKERNATCGTDHTVRAAGKGQGDSPGAATLKLNYKREFAKEKLEKGLLDKEEMLTKAWLWKPPSSKSTSQNNCFEFISTDYSSNKLVISSAPGAHMEMEIQR